MRKSHLVAVLPLPFFVSLASAQVFPNCTSGWDWSYNSLGQNPCNVAAVLEWTCFGGFAIAPVPQGKSYRGPDGGESDPCECNTVVYSLVSACGACQGASWIQWSEWIANCSTPSSAGKYPNGIPIGTRVPHWAYLDVTGADTWNETAAQSAGDKPEGTSSMIGGNKSSNTASIACGVVGGILCATLLASFMIWYIRRCRWRSGAFGLLGPEMSTPTPKLYDPNPNTTSLKTSLFSPSTTVMQTTHGREIFHSPSPLLSVDGNRYTGLSNL